MGVFVQISDFKEGKFKLALNQYNEGDLQSIIDKHEKIYIIELFGLAMGNAIYSAPASQLALTAPFQEEINDFLVISEGVTEMLKGFIFFEYIRATDIKSIVGGTVQNSSDQGTVLKIDVVNRYNDSIDTWEAIQYKCLNDSTTYPDFNGQEKEGILPI